MCYICRTKCKGSYALLSALGLIHANKDIVTEDLKVISSEIKELTTLKIKKGKKKMSLVLKNVSKSFVGKKVVDNISFSLTKPGVYGLLGTNGAGKTTTIRMLLGIIKKDSGEITWKGKTVDRKYVKFGYLPEERGVYPKTKIFDQLMYFAELKGMKKDDAINSINKWAKELKVEEYLQMTAEKL